MSTPRPPQGPLLGFLVFEQTANNDGFIAALMATDTRGYPLEFRATTPVRPSSVQKTLYGGRLEHYVGVELCGRPLIEQAQNKFEAVLVPYAWMLDISNELDQSIVAVWRAGSAITVEEGDVSAIGTIPSPSNDQEPLVYQGRFTDEESKGRIVSLMEECGTQFDLLEVFTRMRAALELLGKEDSRYS